MKNNSSRPLNSLNGSLTLKPHSENRPARSVCVYCGSGHGTSPAYAAAARILGQSLAEAGIGLVYGGGSLGLMGEVARATLDAGGHVTGIIPSHIRNGDLWIMGLADLATRVLHGLAYLALALAAYNGIAYLRGFEPIAWTAIAILYLTPAAINLLQLALSRAREYEADRLAAALTGDPMGLASALRRVETYTGHFWEDLTPPVPARRVPQPSLLRTHPPADQRVARLLDLAAPALGGSARHHRKADGVTCRHGTGLIAATIPLAWPLVLTTPVANSLANLSYSPISHVHPLFRGKPRYCRNIAVISAFAAILVR